MLYRGKHIVKHENKNGVTVETYVEFENGLIYLKTYVGFELYSSVCIADLTTELKCAICAITGKACPYATNENGEKPCKSECEIGKKFLKNFTPIHDDT